MSRASLALGLLLATASAASASVSAPPASAPPAPAPPASAPPASPATFSETRFIVKFRARPQVEHAPGLLRTQWPDVDGLLQRFDAEAMDPLFPGRRRAGAIDRQGLDRFHVVKTRRPIDVPAAIRAFRGNPRVEWVEPDYLISLLEVGVATQIPNDPAFATRQWALHNTGTQTLVPSTLPITAGADIKATQAWDVTTGDSSVVVAVVDTGMRLDHPEFAGRIWTNPGEIPDNGVDDDGNGLVDDVHGWNFSNLTPAVDDDYGHGTAVAGTIGASANNGRMIAGVDWACRLLPVKVLNAAGYGLLSQIAAGVVYAADQGARVINMSLGGYGGEYSLGAACQYAHDGGAFIAAAMGNEDTSVPLYPAAFDDWVTAVGSTDPQDNRCHPSVCHYGPNYGPHIDVVAPGTSIIVLDYADTTSLFSVGGTSLATPLVSGLASLILARKSSLQPDEIRDIIRYSAADQVGRPEEDRPGFDIYHGYGRIDCSRAMTLALNVGFPVVSAPASVRAAEGAPFSFEVTAADPDGDPIGSLTADLSGIQPGPSFTVGEDHSRGVFSWTPSYDDAGTYAVRFVASNPFPRDATTSIEIVDVPDPPAVTAPSTITRPEGTPIDFTVTAADPDADPLTSLTAAPLPPGAQFTASPGFASGRLEWTPGYMQAGSYVVTFAATSLDPDGPLGGPLVEQGTARTFFTILEGPDQPPVVTAPAAISGREGDALQVEFSVTDPDGDPIIDVHAATLPVGAVLTVSEDRTSGAIAWTPGFDQAGAYAVTISATSAHRATGVSQPEPQEAFATIDITVANVNRAPEARAGGPYAGVVNVPIAFDGTGSSDPDGGTLAYSWSFGDAGTATGPAPLHSYTAGGAYRVALLVSDGEAAASDSTDATVQEIFLATAFPDAPDKNLRLLSPEPTVCLRIEPRDGSYANSAVDIRTIQLISAGTGAVDRITAAGEKNATLADRNRNGAEELAINFSKTSLRQLLSSVPAGHQRVPMVVEGALSSGGRFQAHFDWDVVAARGLSATVAPSPVRDRAALSLRKASEGPLRVALFDAAGRLVRVVVDEVAGPAGYQDVRLDGRDKSGRTLRSGVYFYRVETRERTLTGRFVIVK